MEFHFTEPQTDVERIIGGSYCINAIGRINPDDHVRFKEFLIKVAPPPRLTVYIDSLGGDVDASIGIGRLVRDHWFSTSVGSYILNHDEASSIRVPRKQIDGICTSAATLIFIGGRLRFLPEASIFGVHQFSFRDPTPDDLGRSQALSARIAAYLHEMGITPRFLELSSKRPNSEIDVIDHQDLRSLKIVTGGVTEAEWSVHAQNQTMYVRGERDSIHGHQKVMLCYSRATGFMFWAVTESQGREEELTNFSLVEIVVNDEAVRIDVSERCERQVHGIYTNVLARITDEEARIIAFSDSFGVQIRFSSDAGMFLGISAVSTEGGREKLATFFNTLCAT